MCRKTISSSASLYRQRATGQHLGQRYPLEQIHHQVRLAIGLAHLVNHRQTGVSDPGKHRRLPPELHLGLGRTGRSTNKDLQRILRGGRLRPDAAHPKDPAVRATSQLRQHLKPIDRPDGSNAPRRTPTRSVVQRILDPRV